MELAVHDNKGKKTSKKAKLSDTIFSIEPNDHAIYLDTKYHMAKKREGNSKVKARAEITGSTRKIKRQKGTGSARAGSIKSPIFRGGGRVFGPEPRLYNIKLNKKQRQIARKSALSYKIKQEGLYVIQDLNFKEPKTKNYTEIVKNMELEGRTLLVVPESNTNVHLAVRNVQKAKVIPASELNTYDVLNAKNVVLIESAIEKIENLLS